MMHHPSDALDILAQGVLALSPDDLDSLSEELCVAFPFVVGAKRLTETIKSALLEWARGRVARMPK